MGTWWLILGFVIGALIGFGMYRVERSMRGSSIRQAVEDHACMLLIREICCGEEWSVTLDGGNPDFGGPDYAIELHGDWKDLTEAPENWTGDWTVRRFDGATHLDCLIAALKAKGGFDEWVIGKLRELGIDTP